LLLSWYKRVLIKEWVRWDGGIIDTLLLTHLSQNK
jgi:hypothetical protein